MHAPSCTPADASRHGAAAQPRPGPMGEKCHANQTWFRARTSLPCACHSSSSSSSGSHGDFAQKSGKKWTTHTHYYSSSPPSASPGRRGGERVRRERAGDDEHFFPLRRLRCPLADERRRSGRANGRAEHLRDRVVQGRLACTGKWAGATPGGSRRAAGLLSPLRLGPGRTGPRPVFFFTERVCGSLGRFGWTFWGGRRFCVCSSSPRSRCEVPDACLVIRTHLTTDDD